MDRRYKQPPCANYYSYDDRYAYEDDVEFLDHYDPDFRSQELRGQQREGTKEEAEEEKGKGKESMASWLGRVTSSSQAQFAATAIVSGAVVAGAILGYQAVRRQERVEELKSGIPEAKEGYVGDKVRLLSPWRRVGSLTIKGRG
jgi:hypothetical protein